MAGRLASWVAGFVVWCDCALVCARVSKIARIGSLGCLAALLPLLPACLAACATMPPLSPLPHASPCLPAGRDVEHLCWWRALQPVLGRKPHGQWVCAEVWPQQHR
jgi:hypothetical protein